MSALDHRAEAVRLLAVANDRHADADPEGAAIFTQQAQVHATLAGPSTRTVEFVSRPAGVDQGLRDLLSAARTLIAHAVLNVREDISEDRMLILPGDFDALVEQVNEATEAGL